MVKLKQVHHTHIPTCLIQPLLDLLCKIKVWFAFTKYVLYINFIFKDSAECKIYFILKSSHLTKEISYKIFSSIYIYIYWQSA